MNSQIHLENFVESSNSLPTELTRMLATIKDLDERSQTLSDRIQDNVQECLEKPPQAANTGKKATEVAELRAVIAADQAMLIQFAEEKMALSHQCYDLVDMHLLQIDRDIEVFEAEMQIGHDNRVPGAEMQAEAVYEAELAELPPPVEPIRSKRLKDADKPPPSKGARQREREEPKRQDSDAAAIAKHQQMQMQQLQLQHQQQQAQMQQVQQQQLQQMQLQQQQLAQQQAAAAPVPAAAPPATAGVSHRRGYGGNNHFRSGEERSGGSSVADELALQGVPQAVLPPHLEHSAPNTQLSGRTLRDSDITPGLEGMRAEMFWPDDSLWYLVEISSVDMRTHRARVIYTTGETEEIDLNEIVHDKALSLINNQTDLW